MVLVSFVGYGVLPECVGRLSCAWTLIDVAASPPPPKTFSQLRPRLTPLPSPPFPLQHVDNSPIYAVAHLPPLAPVPCFTPLPFLPRPLASASLAACGQGAHLCRCTTFFLEPASSLDPIALPPIPDAACGQVAHLRRCCLPRGWP